MASQTELAMQVHSANDQVRKLQSRIVTSPKELKAALATLGEELKDRRNHLVETDRKAKDFDARINLMRTIEEVSSKFRSICDRYYCPFRRLTLSCLSLRRQ